MLPSSGSTGRRNPHAGCSRQPSLAARRRSMMCRTWACSDGGRQGSCASSCAALSSAADVGERRGVEMHQPLTPQPWENVLPVMSGKRAFLDLLKQEGVEIMFGNPGTTELPLMDAFAT